ncbi:alkaline phosphatase family protein [Alteromonas pelagimontana]|uniref:Alkaline phosphatase family protein n=2 Tax=Alteromonas pelagimontana TaxID=1858656 RepID=A0A6M4MIA3_9ALTE|nr:alkaline phosphatase family protein [Alteromonas pelagimontana]
MKVNSGFVIALGLLSVIGISHANNQTGITNSVAQNERQHVVLMSLDGFRHDYIEKHDAKNLARIASEGVRAKNMLSVYPASTFPNHISIITGLLPVHHGIVNNAFYDKKRPKGDTYARYSMGKGGADSTWIQGMPLWNLVEFSGFKSATYFWPESDALINGATPSYYYHYSKYSDYQARIDQIIQWLSLPEGQRPLFVAGYFSLVDSMGHKFGPDAQETHAAVQTVDTLIGQLYDRLQALPVPVNLVIVSDHGMTKIEEKRLFNVDTLDIDDDAFVVEVASSQTMIYAKPGVKNSDIDKLRQSLQRLSQGRYHVLTDAEREERYMPANSRTGDILLEISPPASFTTTDGHRSVGRHGYLPSHPDMGALFVAAGPAFKKDVTLPVMQNLAIYPGLAKIMGLKLLTDVDGNTRVFEKGLKTP